MMNKTRKTLLGAGAGLFVLAMATAASAQQRSFDIPAQEAARAIPAFALQAGVQISAPVSQLKGVRTPAIRGQMDARAALRRLLAGTGLEVATDDGAVITLRRAGEAPAQGDVSQAEPEAEEATAVEEIIVTAQKREERLLEVPVPITVVSGDELVASNQTQLQDYFARIPGLSITNSGYTGGSIVSIRGITSGIFNDGTTGVVIDDIPFGNSSATGSTEIVPEIDPADLARLEVLRGPQGTLYGASSMGGLLKYVTVDPSLDRFSAKVRAGMMFIESGDGPAFNGYGAVNLPLGDTLALRASVFSRQQPGYIDDPQHGLKDVNSGTISGARLSLLWRPSDAFSAKLGVLLQDSDIDGNDYVTAIPALGFTIDDLKQNNAPGSGGLRRKLQLYSATLKGSVGSFEVTSLSAFSINDTLFIGDYSTPFGSTANANFPGFNGAISYFDYETERFSQELRLETPIGDHVEWMLGAFYNHERVPQFQRVIATNFQTGAQSGTVALLDFPSKYEEQALFSQLRFKLSDTFDIQVGGRYSQDRQSLTQTNSGALFGANPIRLAELKSTGDSFTYLVTPRWRPSPELMVYARLASGYRPGGPNVNANSGGPTAFNPDTTVNWELGAKGVLFDRRLTFDVSVYHITWDDLIVTVQSTAPPVVTYKTNGGEAKSQGLDAALQLRPGAGLTFSATGAWNTAELTADFPATSNARGRTGDRLPFSARFTGALSVDQDIVLSDGIEAFWGATVSRVGERIGPFTAPSLNGARERLPAYSKLDLRAGVRQGDWTLNVFVNNVTDERGRINGGLGNFLPAFYNLIPPRSAGLSIEKTF